MCHASITTTMDIYTATVGREKRETAGRVATAVLGNILVIQHPNKPKFAGNNHRNSMIALVAGACNALNLLLC
jgi:hypothetical protein